MVGCAAINCSNSSDKGFRLFRFPINDERKKRWILNCRRGSWVPGPGSRLCEVHFEESQFECKRADNWKKLRQDAIPSLFDVPNPLLQVAEKRIKGILPKPGSITHKIEKQEEVLLSSTRNMSRAPVKKAKKSALAARKFRKEWLAVEEFRPWLERVENEPSKCHCTWCEKKIHAKIHELKRHIGTKQHQEFEKQYKQVRDAIMGNLEGSSDSEKQTDKPATGTAQIIKLFKDVSAMEENENFPQLIIGTEKVDDGLVVDSEQVDDELIVDSGASSDSEEQMDEQTAGKAQIIKLLKDISALEENGSFPELITDEMENDSETVHSGISEEQEVNSPINMTEFAKEQSKTRSLINTLIDVQKERLECDREQLKMTKKILVVEQELLSVIKDYLSAKPL